MFSILYTVLENGLLRMIDKRRLRIGRLGGLMQMMSWQKLQVSPCFCEEASLAVVQRRGNLVNVL